jgi:hypothetical protein
MEKEMPNTREENLELLAQDRLAKFQKQFEPYPLRYSSGMYYLEQTKYVSWDCTRFRDPIEILHFTDVQWGHVLCRKDKVHEYIDWILRERNRFIVFGGDMIDAGTKVSLGSPWEQELEPSGQVYSFCEAFARVRHRILGFVGGNHERRGVLTFGDLGSLLAHLLQVPYSAGRQFIDFNFKGGESFRMDLWHGGGAARTAGSKMQMLHRFMQSGDSQLYLVGHLHDAMVKIDARIVRQPKTNKVKLVKIGGAMSSSFLDYFGSYAEVAGLAPSSLVMARVIAEPNGHWELTLR